MRILIIGKVKITENLIKKIHKINKKYIVGIVTNSNYKTNDDYVDLIPLCKKKSLSYLRTQKINSKLSFEWIKKKNPDYIFCVGYPKLLDKKYFSLFKGKIIGFHPSLLPFNRGRHPIIWSILLGLKKSACTFFYITDEPDKGIILDQTKFSISEKDDASSIYKKINNIAKNRINIVLKKISKGFKSKEKNYKYTNIWRKRDLNEGTIDWRMSVLNILRHINALKPPYSYARFSYRGKLYKIINAKKIDYKSQYYDEFGKILKFSNNSFIIKCGDGYLKIQKTSPTLNLKRFMKDINKNIYL